MHRITGYLTLALVIIGIITILYIPVLFILKKKGILVLRQLGFLGLACSVVIILFPTILFTGLDFESSSYIINLQPFAWIGDPEMDYRFLGELVPNILMFIPLGIFVPIVWKRCRNIKIALYVYLVTTISIETVQFCIGRSADIDDVILNTLGGILGFGIYTVANRVLRKQNWWKIVNGSH